MTNTERLGHVIIFSMKTTLPHKILASTAFLVAATTAPSSLAINVTLDATDGGGASSFNTNLNWDNNQAPGAGNDYFTSTFTVRTPASSGNFTFAGDSLTLQDGGGRLMYKGSGVGTITVNDLTLEEGGVIVNFGGGTMTLAGSLNIADNSVDPDAIGTLWAGDRNILVTAPVSGTGNFRVRASSSSSRSIIFSATNTYTGDMTLSGMLSMSLSSSGSFAFDIGADGVNNGISGTGTQNATFDGTFNFDLSGASTTGGSSWTIVDSATVNETYNSNFAVAGFSETSGGVWTSGIYQFEEATGLLTVIPEPSAYSFALATSLGILAVLRRRKI